MVYITKRIDRGFFEVDLNRYLYRQYSDNLIEITKVTLEKDFLTVLIRSEMLDENSLTLLWDYIKEDLLVSQIS